MSKKDRQRNFDSVTKVTDKGEMPMSKIGGQRLIYRYVCQKDVGMSKDVGLSHAVRVCTRASKPALVSRTPNRTARLCQRMKNLKNERINK